MLQIITSEGNSGFYELGCFDIPQRHGYSIIGWNHPGFAHSTGKPTDWHDANAAEAVYKYAIDVLEFSPSKIILYGWSIGGFPTCYLANSHPNVGGVIIDASFGNFIPLAKGKMPEFMGALIEGLCSLFFDLDNEYYIQQYEGPVRVIRRTRDEVIGDDVSDPSSNHGNSLITSILKSRYPQIFTDTQVETYLIKWLCSTDSYTRELSLPRWDESECQRLVTDYIGDAKAFGNNFDGPTKVMVAYYLFNNIVDDFENGHNGPLDPALFKLPWSDGFERAN